MNCPRCNAPDFTMTCSACCLLVPRAIQEVQAVLKAIEGRPSVPAADLIRMLEASGVLTAKDVGVILRGIFKLNAEVFSPGPPTPGATTGDLFKRAAVLTALSEQFADALACAQLILEREPSHLAAMMLKGDLLVYLDQLDAATDCFERGRAARPGENAILKKLDALAAFRRGGRESCQGQSAPALESYSEAVDLDPGNFRYLFAKGLLLCALKRHGEALACLDRGLELVPRTAAAEARWAKLSALAELQLVADELFVLTPDDPDLVEAVNEVRKKAH